METAFRDPSYDRYVENFQVVHDAMKYVAMKEALHQAMEKKDLEALKRLVVYFEATNRTSDAEVQDAIEIVRKKVMMQTAMNRSSVSEVKEHIKYFLQKNRGKEVEVQEAMEYVAKKEALHQAMEKKNFAEIKELVKLIVQKIWMYKMRLSFYGKRKHSRKPWSKLTNRLKKLNRWSFISRISIA